MIATPGFNLPQNCGENRIARLVAQSGNVEGYFSIPPERISVTAQETKEDDQLDFDRHVPGVIQPRMIHRQ
jgi:hypothetical protein